MTHYPIGTRVRHIRTGEHATVVERQACADNATTVIYDTDDGVWNTPTHKLALLTEESES